MGNRISPYHGSRSFNTHSTVFSRLHTGLGNTLGVAMPVLSGVAISAGTLGVMETAGLLGFTALAYAERQMAAYRLRRRINNALHTSGIEGYGVTIADAWKAMFFLGTKKSVRMADFYVKKMNGSYFLASPNKADYLVQTSLVRRRGGIDIEQTMVKTKLREWDEAMEAFGAMYGISRYQSKLQINTAA